MSDYDKFTVVKLKDELVKRGLPKTGLKAALVQRLQEHDAQSQSAQSASTAEPIESTGDQPRSETTVQASSPSIQTTQQDHHEERADIHVDPPVTGLAEQLPPATVASEDGKGEDTTDHQVTGVGEVREQDRVDKGETAQEQPLEKEVADDDNSGRATALEAVPEIIPDIGADQQMSAPAQTQESAASTAAPEEIAEDTRKRKRRSQSPPPSSIETQKRLKTDTSGLSVQLPEDSQELDDVSNNKPSTPQSDRPNGVKDDSVPSEANIETKNMKDSFSAEQSVVSKGHSPTAPESNGRGASTSPLPIAQANSLPPDAQDTLSRTKQSPSENRYKNLLPGPSKTESSVPNVIPSEGEDRVISPASHPATSALYIRELMRPLKPENVREHLAALATPPDTSADPGVITDFFLDSIRTHCLVGFTSVSAASRVRSTLHDRIWPNERDRRPLFVDFVPEDKLQEWIDVEQHVPSGRGHAQKRWEVVYEGADGEVKAYLQEVGSHGARRSVDQVSHANAGKGVQGAPSGPRSNKTEAAPQSKSENGQGFRALDDLFKSTTAKPKLYYQPVSQSIAVKRLDRLAEGRGGGRNDEMRRFTFEDNLLVDRAPEFGNRNAWKKPKHTGWRRY